jgi:DNA-binding transcriptional MocR family regulator
MERAAGDDLDLGPLEPGSGTPLYRQIADGVSAQIVGGRLPPGTRLPTVRGLAKTLGVGVITVAQAYEALREANLVSGQVGRGTFVRDRTGAESAHTSYLPSYVVPPIGDPEMLPASPALTLPPFPLPVRAARPNQLMTPAHRAGVISLASGQPAADALPVVHLKKAWRTAVDELDGDLLGYGPALGDPDLRLAIAERCAGWGFVASADDVLITTGGQQGIDLVARSLVGPGERVATEVPTFAAAIDIFAASGARIVPVPTDEHGMDMSALAAVCERERPRLIYTVPTSHNPMGSVLSVDRRRVMLQIAARHGVLILEDDHCNPFVYDREPPPPIKAGDTDGRVIYVWSAAKTVSPDLRVGAVIAGPTLMARLTAMKMVTDRFTARLPQRALVHYWDQGGGRTAARDVAAMRATYHERRDAMLAALNAHLLPYADWLTPKSGLNIWLTLRDGLTAQEVTAVALAEGVATVAGEAFYPAGVDVAPNRLRLTYADNIPETITEGVHRLAYAFERVTALGPSVRRAAAAPV